MNCRGATWEQRFAMRNQTMDNNRNRNQRNNNEQSLNSLAAIDSRENSDRVLSNSEDLLTINTEAYSITVKILLLMPVLL
jgi:hypothetical protein